MNIGNKTDATVGTHVTSVHLRDRIRMGITGTAMHCCVCYRLWREPPMSVVS